MKALYFWQVRPVDFARAQRKGRRRLRPDEASLRAWAERYKRFWDGSRHNVRAASEARRVWAARRGTYKWISADGGPGGRRKFARAPYEAPFRRPRRWVQK